MKDEHFSMFIEAFGNKTRKLPVPAAALQAWKGRLPDALLEFWSEEGWGGYADGLFWVVDPGAYEDLKDQWLADTPLARADRFHVFARTAFGDLYLWGEQTGVVVTLACPLHSIIYVASDFKRKKGDPDARMRRFFGNREPEDCDLEDEDAEPLFSRALQQLGPLAPDEMYGFEPALVIGGRMQLDHLAKVKLDAHLTVLRQLAAPSAPYADTELDLD